MNMRREYEKKPELTVFYDSLCYICNKEVAFLKKRDKKNEMLTVDITKNDFDAKAYGLDMSTPSRRHARNHKAR